MTSYQRRLLTVYLLLGVTLVWIWGNSLLPAETSSVLSGGVRAFVDRLFGISPDGGIGGEGILRKIAHLFEFAVLGAETAAWILLRLRGDVAKNARAVEARIAGQRPAIVWLFCGMVTALIDETIQIWSPGRAAMIQDVWIDVAGFVLGGGILWIAVRLWKRRQERKARK